MAKNLNAPFNTVAFALLFGCFAFITGTWLGLMLSIGLAFAGAVLLREYVISKRVTPPANGGVLITGCSTGIGEDAALKLAKQGLLVFAGVRKTADAESLLKKAGGAASRNLFPLILDVCDQNQVNDAVQTVKARLAENKAALLAIVNNAGYAEAGPVELIPLDRLRKQLDVNVVGLVGVTQAFLPLLRLKPEGAQFEQSRRIINISSGVGVVSFAGSASYCASKHAVEAISDSLRMEVKHWNIDVAVIQPGAIDTAFAATNARTRNENAEAASKSGAERCGADVMTLYDKWAKNAADLSEKKTRAPVSVTTDAIEAALFDSKPLTRYLAGKDVQMLPIARLLPDRILDLVLANGYGK